MSKMGFETVFYFENFDCAGDEVLVETSPPASPINMAARLAAPAQGDSGGGGAGGGGGNTADGTSPGAVRELIVIPEIPSSIHLHHAMHQISSTVVEVNGVEVNGDSSGHSSPTADAQHTYITVAVEGPWEERANSELKSEVKCEMDSSDQESEGGAGVNYHVQYVEPQEIYTQPHAAHMEALRTYPVYGVATVGGGAGEGGGGAAPGGAAEAEGGWGVGGGVFAAYDVVVAADEAEAPASPATPAAPHQPPRMPPATVQWLLDNYETAEGVSLPRSTLYAHYLRHCAAHRLEPVNAASFGKLIRSVFIGLRTRRLGTRGNSKYHYYGIKAKTGAPDSPSPQSDDKTDVGSQDGRDRDGSDGSVGGGGGGGGGPAHRQYLGSVSPPEPPELIIDDLPDDVPQGALDALKEHHRTHGSEFLEAVAALDTAAVERARRAFWRRPAAGLCRRALLRLTARRDVATWLRRAELLLHQRAVELLLPDVLRPIPPHLTQAIRNFAKTLEAALSAGSSGAPAPAARAQAFAATALAAALRRYTSLNHLAQAARAVLHNQHQIQQMLADLNRVDFRVVREQAAWACSCPSAATANRLEADFKATLGRGASLEQWAGWLETCVKTALAPHERRPDYSARARRFLLDWSFYSSLVIRELTLRSAASFGSFHLIRLLYDEYVAYLVERRVAVHEKSPPIAVMHRVQESEEEAEGLEVPMDGVDGDEPDAGDDDPDWEWDDDDDDDSGSCKKPKIESNH